VNRPCGDDRLFEALFAFMQSTSAFFASPDHSPPLRVASEGALEALLAANPKVEGGDVLVVHTADELRG
jgi:hypothetical protein